jgi:hypothetical protein
VPSHRKGRKHLSAEYLWAELKALGGHQANVGAKMEEEKGRLLGVDSIIKGPFF